MAEFNINTMKEKLQALKNITEQDSLKLLKDTLIKFVGEPLEYFLNIVDWIEEKVQELNYRITTRIDVIVSDGERTTNDINSQISSLQETDTDIAARLEAAVEDLQSQINEINKKIFQKI